MTENGSVIFDFTYGWCFGDWAQLRIKCDNGKRTATLLERSVDSFSNRHFEVPKSDIQDIHNCLCKIGANEWFCNYKPIQYLVMDGFS